MSMPRTVIGLAAVLVLAAVGAFFWSVDRNDASVPEDQQRFGFGTTPTDEELAGFLSIKPDGTGLPRGEGNYAEGERIYVAQCASCHGIDLRGMPRAMEMPPEMAAMGSDRLIGGRDSHRNVSPIFTVESHWPYGTTLWDYLKRTMPLMEPGSLSDDEAYSLVAYILAEADIIPKDRVMNERTLPEVVMPNQDGFVGDPRPEPELQP